MKIHGLGIDAQNSFCWPGLEVLMKEKLGRPLAVDEEEAWHHIAPLIQLGLGDELFERLVKPGELFVPGADEDMFRASELIHRIADRIDDMHLTLDSHQHVDQAHTGWFVNVSDGSKPDPFTILGLDDQDRIIQMMPQTDGSLVPSETYFTTRIRSLLKKGGIKNRGTVGYLKELARLGRGPHVLWPDHCLIGTWGHMLYPVVREAISAWEHQFCSVDYVTKGSNPNTEHFSAVEAEVEDPEDSTTAMNSDLMEVIEDPDVHIVFTFGQASSHCVRRTIEDLFRKFRDKSCLKKIVCLTDCMSPVPGFEKLADDFFRDMSSEGMQLSTSDKFLL